MHWEVLKTEKYSRWQYKKIVKKFITEEEAKNYKNSLQGYSELYLVSNK